MSAIGEDELYIMFSYVLFNLLKFNKKYFFAEILNPLFSLQIIFTQLLFSALPSVKLRCNP